MELDGHNFALERRNGLYFLHCKLEHPKSPDRVAHAAGAQLTRWHERLAHLNHKTIVSMLDSGCVPDLQIDDVRPATSGKPRRNVVRAKPCTACRMTKQVAHSHPHFRQSLAHEATAPGEVVYSDVKSVSVASFDGHKYAVCFIDAYTRYSYVVFTRTKSAKAVTNAMTSFVEFMKRHGHTVNAYALTVAASMTRRRTAGTS